MKNWTRAKAGTGNQHTLKSDGNIHIIHRSNNWADWSYTEWDSEGNRIDRGKQFRTLAEAKAYIEEWFA